MNASIKLYKAKSNSITSGGWLTAARLLNWTNSSIPSLTISGNSPANANIAWESIFNLTIDHLISPDYMIRFRYSYLAETCNDEEFNITFNISLYDHTNSKWTAFYNYSYNLQIII